VNNLVEEYIANVNLLGLSLDEYGDKEKVKKNNKIAARNILIVEELEKENSEAKKQFISLMDAEDKDLRSRVAHHILEKMITDKAIRLKALRIIKERIENTTNPADRMGNQLWLKDYYKNHPEDKE
jgi:hypothetical protein